MNGVAAEIAKKIGVLFQNDYGHTRSREQVAGHDARWSTADNYAASFHFSLQRSFDFNGLRNINPNLEVRSSKQFLKTE